MLVLGYERRDWSSQCLLAGGRAPEPETDVVGVADDSFRNGQQIGLKQGQRRDASRDLALICKTATVRSTTFSIKLERLPVVSAYISWARLAVLTGKRRHAYFYWRTSDSESPFAAPPHHTPLSCAHGSWACCRVAELRRAVGHRCAKHTDFRMTRLAEPKHATCVSPRPRPRPHRTLVPTRTQARQVHPLHPFSIPSPFVAPCMAL